MTLTRGNPPSVFAFYVEQKHEITTEELRGLGFGFQFQLPRMTRTICLRHTHTHTHYKSPQVHHLPYFSLCSDNHTNPSLSRSASLLAISIPRLRSVNQMSRWIFCHTGSKLLSYCMYKYTQWQAVKVMAKEVVGTSLTNVNHLTVEITCFAGGLFFVFEKPYHGSLSIINKPLTISVKVQNRILYKKYIFVRFSETV